MGLQRILKQCDNISGLAAVSDYIYQVDALY